MNCARILLLPPSSSAPDLLMLCLALRGGLQLCFVRFLHSQKLFRAQHAHHFKSRALQMVRKLLGFLEVSLFSYEKASIPFSFWLD
jgi:hypothetical protein